MNKLSLFICATISALCFFYGGEISIAKQLPIYESLRNTSAIIFGVMGAWIAILYPNALLEIYGRKDSPSAEKQTKNIKQLISPMILSTIIVSLVLIVSLIDPVIRTIHNIYEYRQTIRSISFGLLGALTSLQLLALLASLAPSDMLRKSFSTITLKRKKIEKKFPNMKINQ